MAGVDVAVVATTGELSEERPEPAAFPFLAYGAVGILLRSQSGVACDETCMVEAVDIPDMIPSLLSPANGSYAALGQ